MTRARPSKGAAPSLLGRLDALCREEPRLLEAAHLARAHGCRILLVGGAVRDLTLGRRAGDLDFILEVRASEGKGAPGERPSGAGRTGRERTRRFLRALARLIGHRVVTFRKRDIVDHRIRTGHREWDFVERGTRTLRREILRRDFTLNAIAYDPLARRILDPAGGLLDAARRRIRATAPDIFEDDPLRMMRAVRLAAEIPSLAIAKGTAALIRRHARRLSRTSTERIKAEMDRILASARPSAAVRALDRLGLLPIVLPELDPLRGLVQNRYHHLDAFEHTLCALEAADDPRVLAKGLGPLAFAADPLAAPSSRALRSGAPVMSRERALVLRWSLLLHDTGKAETRTIGEDGDYHFYLHDQVSARIARDAMRRLRASRAETAAIERLVFLHLRVSIPASGGVSPRALRRMVRDAGPLTSLLALHSLADKAASQGIGHARTMARLRRAGAALLEAWRLDTERMAAGPPLVTGRDVMRVLGIGPGPEVGRRLEEIAELRGLGTLTTREEALRHLATGEQRASDGD